MRGSDVIIGDEHNPQAVADARVMVDDIGDIVYEFDDEFCQRITGCRLAGENDGARWNVEARIIAQAVIAGDDVQNIE